MLKRYNSLILKELLFRRSGINISILKYVTGFEFRRLCKNLLPFW